MFGMIGWKQARRVKKKNSAGNENTSQEFAVVNICNNQQLPMSV